MLASVPLKASALVPTTSFFHLPARSIHRSFSSVKGRTLEVFTVNLAHALPVAVAFLDTGRLTHRQICHEVCQHFTLELKQTLIFFFNNLFASHLIFYSIKAWLFLWIPFLFHELPYEIIQWGEVEVSETGDQSLCLSCIQAVSTALPFISTLSLAAQKNFLLSGCLHGETLS